MGDSPPVSYLPPTTNTKHFCGSLNSGIGLYNQDLPRMMVLAINGSIIPTWYMDQEPLRGHLVLKVLGHVTNMALVVNGSGLCVLSKLAGGFASEARGSCGLDPQRPLLLQCRTHFGVFQERFGVLKSYPLSYIHVYIYIYMYLYVYPPFGVHCYT